MSKELEQFRNEVKQYCQENILPNVDAWGRKGNIPDEILEEMAKRGFFEKCSNLVENGFEHRVVLAEELGKVQTLSLACCIINTLNMPLFLLEKFQSELTNRYRNGILKEGKTGAIAVTEEYGGSDMMNSIKTEFSVQKDKIVINGTKKFILNLPGADFVIVFGKSNTKRNDIFAFSLILVPTNLEGITIERTKTTGIHSTQVGTITFDNCVVPKENLLGKVGNGYVYMGQALTAERIVGNISLVAMTKEVLRDTIGFTCGKELFGKKLFDMQSIRHGFADMAAEYEIVRALLYDMVRQYQLEKLSSSKYQVEVAKAKLMCSKKCGEIIEKCNHILGGQGFLVENWIPKAYLDVLGCRFFAGSNETMMQFIAQKL